MSSESYDVYNGFHGGSDSKEATCNIGDLGSIPGPERSAREGNNVYNALQFLILHLWIGDCAAFVLNRTASLPVNLINITSTLDFFLLFALSKSTSGSSHDYTRYTPPITYIHIHPFTFAKWHKQKRSFKKSWLGRTNHCTSKYLLKASLLWNLEN